MAITLISYFISAWSSCSNFYYDSSINNGLLSTSHLFYLNGELTYQDAKHSL